MQLQSNRWVRSPGWESGQVHSARMVFEDRPRLIAALSGVEKLPDPVLGIPLPRFVHMATQHGIAVLGRRFITKDDFDLAKKSAWLAEAVAVHEARPKKKRRTPPPVHPF